MIKRILLLLSLSVAFFSCNDDNDDVKGTPTPTPLPDTCLLSSLNTGIPASSINLVYDSVTYLPISGNIGTSSRITYEYNNTNYKLISQSTQGGTDTTSIINITVDADKKALVLSAKTLNQGNIFVYSTQTLSYNPDKTLKGISTFSYRKSVLGGAPLDSSYSEEKIYWTNGNLTTDSVFTILDKGTPQETKVLSFIRRWEFGTQADIKGVSEWLINTTYIAKLFGERSKNLATKIITQTPTGSTTEVRLSFLLNANKWPTNVTLSGAQTGGAAYSYTCYKRK
jgi:hypothetical protein